MTGSGPDRGTKVRDVRVSAKALQVDMADGRSISAPLRWFPRLLRATRAQRRNWKVTAGGFGIHWPDLDEDLSAEGLLRGAHAPGSRSR